MGFKFWSIKKMKKIINIMKQLKLFIDKKGNKYYISKKNILYDINCPTEIVGFFWEDTKEIELKEK